MKVSLDQILAHSYTVPWAQLRRASRAVAEQNKLKVKPDIEVRDLGFGLEWLICPSSLRNFEADTHKYAKP
jgi:hypothetical protein